MRVTLLVAFLFSLLQFSPVLANPDSYKDDISRYKSIAEAGGALTPEQKAILVGSQASYVGPVRMEPRRDDEGGPDEFGYKWIDSNEEGGPEFDWIEIEDLDGARQLQFNNPDDGNSGPIELGFEFPFYDDVFETIRMCTNGWASFTSGSVRYVNDDFRLPGGDVENILCACMTDLNPRVGGGCWFWSNEEMAVLSWLDVPHYSNNNEIFTFQIVIYPNGRIFFNYLAIGGHENDIVIGIQNGDRDIGLEIESVGGNYIEEELAIRIGAQSGWVTGTVTDLENDDPIADALLTLSDGTEAATDEEGVFWLNDIPEDDYTLTAYKFGYNRLVNEEFFVADQETLAVDFALPHPEIEVTADDFDIELDPNQQLEEEFDIINDGNGELEFSMYLAVPEEEGRDPVGDIIFDWNVGEQTGDNDILGVTTDGENFYVTGSNDGGTPQVYVFNRLGELVHQYDQPVEDPSEDGFTGIVTDGNFLYSADGEDITQFTFNGEFIATLPGHDDISPILHIAYDPESDHFLDQQSSHFHIRVG